MDDRELEALLYGRIRTKILVCRLHASLVRRLGAQTDAVYLSRKSIEKQHWKHAKLEFGHYKLIPIILGDGAAIAQKVGIEFLYTDTVVYNHSFRTAIKRTADGHELYVVSHHKIEDSKYRQKMRRAVKRGALVRWHHP